MADQLPGRPGRTGQGKDGGSRLGQLLLEKGWATGEQLLRAVQSQRALGGRLGTCLLEMGAVSEEHLLEMLSLQLGVPAVRIEQLRCIPEHILELVPAKVAQRCEAVPFSVDEAGVHIATLNVHHLAILDELAFCTNQKIVPHIANEARLFEALEKYYHLEVPKRYGHLLDRLNRSRYMWSSDAEAMIADATTPGGSALDREIEFDPTDDKKTRDIPARIDLADDPDATYVLADRRAAERRAAHGNRAGVPNPNDETLPIIPLVTPTVSQGGDEPTLDKIDRRLAKAVDHQTVARIVLTYLARHFTRCALFKVRPEHVIGWLAYGEGFDSQLFRAMLIPFDEPSLFLNLRQGAQVHLGPLPEMPSHRQMVRAWGGEWPAQCMMVPVRVRGKLVSVLYGDRGAESFSDFELDPFTDLAAKAADALELCILRKKLRSD